MKKSVLTKKPAKMPAVTEAIAEKPAKKSAIAEKPAKTLAEKLKALRKEKKIKLKDLAAQAGLSYDQYKGLEYRNAHPRNVKTYDRLAEILGCEASYLAEGDKRYKPSKNKPEEKPAKKVTVIPAKIPAPVEESVPTENAVDEKTKPDLGEIEENIPEEPVVSVTENDVKSASSEVIKLVSRLSVLLAGDEISKSEKDAIMVALNGAYWKG